MSLKVIKDARSIKQNEEGNYEFEHTLVQELGQTNVNAIVDSYTMEKENAEKFLENYDSMFEELKQKTLERLEEQKKSSEEFLKGITEENKTKIALEYLDKLIETKKKFIDEFDKIVKESHEHLERYTLPQKEQSMRALDNAKKTLEIWTEHYKEESE